MYGICMRNTIQGEGLELSTSQDLGGGGDLLHYPGSCGFMRGHRQMAWGGEPKGTSQFLAWQEGFSLINVLLETINAHLYRYQR